MTATHSTRMLILGSGPAGLSAAIYGARAGLAPIVVQGIQPGGQLMTTTDVENYPGFREVIQGPWLMGEMQAQAEHVGAQMLYDTIVEVDLTQRPFRMVGDSGTVYLGDTLVIATGAQAKWLGLDSEEAMKGKGASACATCDGFFYRGKKVAVIGGGNTAVEEALYLTNHSHDVTLIHRRDSLRAEKILQQRLFANPKIKTLWNKEVVEFVGGGDPEGLVGLKLKDTVTGELSDIDVEGGFVAIRVRDHGPGVAPDERERIFDRCGDLGTFAPPRCIAGQHDMTAAGQGAGEALEGLSAHDHGLAHGLRLEAFEIGRQAPGQLSVYPDHAVIGPREMKADQTATSALMCGCAT